MIRMLIVGWFGIRSERRLCEEVHLNSPIVGSAWPGRRSKALHRGGSCRRRGLRRRCERGQGGCEQAALGGRVGSCRLESYGPSASPRWPSSMPRHRACRALKGIPRLRYQLSDRHEQCRHR